jgi:hypothetical protein
MRKQKFFTALIATGLGATAIGQGLAQAPAEEELAVLPEFEAVDVNEDGRINPSETEPLAEMLEDQHQIEFQFPTVDRNRDGAIDLQEYVAYDGVLKERLGIA